MKYRHIIVAIAHVATATHLRIPTLRPTGQDRFSLAAREEITTRDVNVQVYKVSTRRSVLLAQFI